MTEAEAANRLTWLAAKIAAHDTLCHELNEPRLTPERGISNQ